MLIPTILVAALVLFGSAVLFTRTRPFAAPPHCPTCDVAFLELQQPEEGERRTYDVLVCTHCTNAVTRVLGANSCFAWCPCCRQRTLETPIHRLAPQPHAPIAVQVDESCHVCGYRQERVLSDGVETVESRGKVLPFRAR